MKDMIVEYPYPVLEAGRDDYTSKCFFDVSFEENTITVDSYNINVPVTYRLESESLKSMLEQKKAEIVVSVRSNAASYGDLVRFPEETSELLLKIPKFSVVRTIEIVGYILAKTEISDYMGEDLNPIYFAGAKFNLKRGALLAIGETRRIPIDDSELQKPLSSIFNIRNGGNEQEETVTTDFSDEKIVISVKPELHRLYGSMLEENNGALKRYTTSVLVTPVLVEAIDKIILYYQGNGDDYSEKRWFRAIEKKCEKLGITLENYDDSPVTLANKLLGNITVDSLNNVKETLESELNSGATTSYGGVD